MTGGALLMSFCVGINDSMLIIWGTDYALGWLWSSLVLFFVTPLIFGSYICRALRLAVVFHPRAKRALPWLIPVRNILFFATCMHRVVVVVVVFCFMLLLLLLLFFHSILCVIVGCSVEVLSFDVGFVFFFQIILCAYLVLRIIVAVISMVLPFHVRAPLLPPSRDL